MNPTIWDPLHDGKIVAVHGSYPGDLTFEITCGYIAESLGQSPLRAFAIRAENCVYLNYLESRTDLNHPGLSFLDLADKHWFLSAALEGERLALYLENGILTLEYSSESLSWADGEKLTLEELLAAAERYWENFGSKK